MSKKKLLSEAQVKRFMGLAGLKPLKENAFYLEEEEELALDAADDMPPMADDMPPMADDAAPMDDMPEDELEAEESDVQMDEEDIAELKSALDKVQSILAPLTDKVAGEEEVADLEPGMDLEDEPEEAEELADDALVDADEEEEEMDMMESELAEVNMELSEEEIVNEVARRVAKRIVEAKRAHKKMNEALGRKTRPDRRKK